MSGTFEKFIARWTASAAAERANKDTFLAELCDVLGVDRPTPSTGDDARDLYVFERKVKVPGEDGLHTKSIDLYKHDCFILEAKQGSEEGSPKIGTAKRGTPGWHVAMRDALGQALGYADGFDAPPPFVLVCDIGYCFDLYAAFDGTDNYRPFPNALSSRIFLSALPDHADLLRRIWTDPKALDPALTSVKITREVAAHLAELARSLNPKGEKTREQPVARFLMRCLFTMFAEDVGLLPEKLFTNHIQDFWLPNPKAFPNGIRSLWKAMNSGDDYITGKLLQFNGGLFTDVDALPLDQGQLELLLAAAKCDWAEVEPAIFGTLLERALDADERHALGAHFTPKAYVERLVRPTIEEPLRADWDIVQAHVRQLVAAAEETDGKKRKDLLADARKAVRDFHGKLCATRVLDPACGSGNFLYVTLDLFKRLEAEVLAFLAGLGEAQTKLEMETVTVNPSQFLGIEIKPWAKEIAELVLWIGYLQWHFRTYGRGKEGKQASIPEPVLRDYQNIECRDAVLAYDSEEIVVDDRGRPVTRWDGVSMKKHPVTGEDVPDESKQKPLYRYVNPRKAEWPKADFIVGNPPFIGNKRMRAALGDGYAEALRGVYDDVPETVDYVMYWWEKAALLVRRGEVRRFGLITTNSITQTFSRKVLQRHMEAENPLSLVFAIPDHPWVDSESGAAVRIAMTAATAGPGDGSVAAVVAERETDDGVVDVQLAVSRGRIQSDLSVGAAVATAMPLVANSNLAYQGMALCGEGFLVSADEAHELRARHPATRVLRRYRNGQDVTQHSRDMWVIDFFGLSEEQAREVHTAAFQVVVDRVKPDRDLQRREHRRRNYWLFGETVGGFRRAADGLSRYVATCRTAKHRVFLFLDGDILPDAKIIAITLANAFSIGVLSSRIHVQWALKTGAFLEDRPNYNHSDCFGTFPFPTSTDEQKQRIRDLGEALDAHRKQRQAEHADLTITGMYNVLVKLRSGEALTAKEKVIHEKGLVSVLKKIHDDLDAAVFDAYGWPHDLTDEQILERLVALNAERAEEEKRGLVRWLRPDYQVKVVKTAAPAVTEEDDAQEELPVEPAPAAPTKRKRGRAEAATTDGDGRSAGARKAWATRRKAGTKTKDQPAEPATGEKLRWPDNLPEQIAAVRDLVLGSKAAWTAETVARVFKFARTASTEPVLESLAALGLLVRFTKDGERMWKAVRRG